MISQLVEVLLRGVQGSTVTEIEYEANGQRMRIVREPRPTASSVQATAAPTQPLVVAVPTAPMQREVGVVVRATMHGTFYRSSAPDEPPLAEVGQEIQAGQQLALLEAMKMLHSIEAECSGRILKVLADNASAVEPGTPLFELEVAESGGV